MNLFYCTLFLFTEFKRIFFGNISKNGLGINSSDLLRFWKLVVLQLKVHKYNVSPDYFTLILYLSAKLCEVKSSNMCKHSLFFTKTLKNGGLWRIFEVETFCLYVIRKYGNTQKTVFHFQSYLQSFKVR